jgi:hypothetical protein
MAGTSNAARIAVAALLLLAAGFSSATRAADCAGFDCSASPRLKARQGPHFFHVLPAGWEVVEEGKYALVLRSRDLSAGIINYGNSGFVEAMDPPTFAYRIMTRQLHLSNVRFGAKMPIRPMPGYGAAAIIDVAYTGAHGPVHGVVISNVINVYKRTDGVITIAGAKERLWSAYADWLPPIAMLAVNTGDDPYGRGTASAAIQHDVARRSQAAAAMREWSSHVWDEVSQFRAEAQQRQSQALGPMLTGKQWYDNPYGGPAIQQSASPAAIWVNRNGDQLPSDNPNFDPRTPGEPDWRRLVPQKP